METKVQKDWWPTISDMLNAGVPQVLIYFFGNFIGQYFFYQETQLPTQAPRLCKMAEEIVLAFVVGDFGIYWEHRIMHTIPFLRNHIHSWHHYYHAPFSWAGGVVHPFEDAIVVVTQTWFPIVMGHHPLSFWVFVWIWTSFLIEEHSGHDVWWAPYNWLPFARCPLGGGAAPHDIHHYKVTKNYGFVLCVWDHLFETFEPVVEPPLLPANRHRTWWEFSRFIDDATSKAALGGSPEASPEELKAVAAKAAAAGAKGVEGEGVKEVVNWFLARIPGAAVPQ
eukprot:TRINITY_DN36438_c0_g1_i3.p1 TRINITY_DN36438_c0_g1~~TRINITY_DN36438_c0_g1_i3.p1  ORF type:complete len:280 (+),score=59.09 TRINITY_DN36438_c0_g1_i3:307-1146(+)